MSLRKRLFGGYVEGLTIDEALTDPAERGQLEGILTEGSTWLGALWVPPSERGQGKGRELLSNFEDEVKKCGQNRVIGELTPESGERYDDLKKWYQDQGYEIRTTSGGREYVVKDL